MSESQSAKQTQVANDLSLILNPDTNELYIPVKSNRGPLLPAYDERGLQNKKNKTRAEKLSAAAIAGLAPSAPDDESDPEVEALQDIFETTKYYTGDDMRGSSRAAAVGRKFITTLCHPALVGGPPPQLIVEPEASGCSRSDSPPRPLKPSRMPTIDAMRDPNPDARIFDPIRTSDLGLLHYDLKAARCFQCPAGSTCTFSALFGACVECKTSNKPNCSFTLSPDVMVDGYFAEVAEKLDISSEQSQMMLHTLFEQRYIAELNLAAFQQHLRRRNEKHEDFRGRLLRIEQEMPPGYLPLAFEDTDALATAMSSVRYKETGVPDYGANLPSARMLFEDGASRPLFKMMRSEPSGVKKM